MNYRIKSILYDKKRLEKLEEEVKFIRRKGPLALNLGICWSNRRRFISLERTFC
jgi:hypothetical protein